MRRMSSARKLAALGVTAAIVLAACGGSDEADSESDAADDTAESGEASTPGDEAVTISVSHWAIEAPPMSGFKDIVADFNASQDGVIVETINIPYADYSNTIFTQMGAGSGPTVATIEDYDLGKAIDAGLIIDLTDQVATPTTELAAWNDLLVVDGKQYGVGLNLHAYQLFVNRAAFDELGVEIPTTYEDFKAAAELATDGEDGYGFAFRSTQGQLGGWWIDTTNWLIGTGGSWTDADGNPTIATPEAEEAVGRMKDFLDEGLVPAGADAETYRRAFGEGKIPMVIEAMAIGGILATQFPELAENMEMYQPPFGSGNYLGNVSGLSINANASDEERAAAIVFLDYLMQDDVQTKMLDLLGGALVATNQGFSEAAVESWPWLANWDPTGEHVSSTPVGQEANLAEFRQIVLDNIEEIFADKVSIADGLAAAQAEAEELD
jgi:multiple sugar transport system substrate-binding protein